MTTTRSGRLPWPLVFQLLAGALAAVLNVVPPHFAGRATGLHPLPVLVAVLAGVHLVGLIGALVAVPLLATIWEIVRRVYVTRAGAST